MTNRGSKEADDLAIPGPEVVVEEVRIIIGTRRGIEFRVAPDVTRRSLLVVRHMRTEVRLVEDDEAETVITPSEFAAFSRVVDWWRFHRVRLAGTVGFGKSAKGYPAPPLVVATPDVAAPRVLPVNDTAVDDVRRIAGKVHRVEPARKHPELVFTDEFANANAEPTALFARDEREWVIGFTRRNLLISRTALRPTAKLALWLMRETTSVSGPMTVLDTYSAAVIEAARRASGERPGGRTAKLDRPAARRRVRREESGSSARPDGESASASTTRWNEHTPVGTRVYAIDENGGTVRGALKERHGDLVVLETEAGERVFRSGHVKVDLWWHLRDLP